jgi:Na+-transporting NADH:ubiquinone oxidoreductase subunit A
MTVHRVRRGLQLPIAGEPRQAIEQGAAVSHVAVLADDSIGLRPAMEVAEGDDVLRGQLLFDDKRTPGVRYTAPGGGRVAAINRGAKRALQSVVIELSADERAGAAEQVSFASYTGSHPSTMPGDDVRALLLESGLWASLRARPFSSVANPETRPRSVFVTAMDTDPLAPDVEVVMRGHEAEFERGLAAVAKLTDGPVFLCTSETFSLPVPETERLRHERFAGRHPAGTVGLHIHTLDPAGRERLVWHLGYQDVLAIGHLFATGTLDVRRVVSLGGPMVSRPRLLETRLGASTDDLVAGELLPDAARVISGSMLSGRTAMGPVLGFLGRYHRQITALPELGARAFMGWARPGLAQFSATRAFLSGLLRGRRFAMNTALNGSHRAIMPMGLFEQVMPFDLEPTFLLKALVTGDVENAEALGCLELDEEDVALCTFVCTGKNDYGPQLRRMLATIEKEG